VGTAHGRVRALGTRFTVRERDGHTLLAVHDGAVRVQPAGDAEPVTVYAGRQVRFHRHGIAAAEAADPARDAWARGVLLARDITLDKLVGELARYQYGHMGVSPAVADLRVFGSFPARRPEKALAMLEDLLPIRVRRPLPWWTTIEAAGGLP
jgi:transmembrane sensor